MTSSLHSVEPERLRQFPPSPDADWRERLRLLAGNAARAGDDAIRRVEVKLDRVRFQPSLLDAAPWHPRMFWRKRDGQERVAAFGALLTGSMRTLATELESAGSGVRLFGGANFDPAPSLFDDWESFPSSLFFIPRVELIESNRHLRLALNIRGPADEEAVIEWLDSCAFSPPLPPPPAALSRFDTPHFEEWQRSVAKALDLMRCGVLSKAVLARRSRFELETAARPFQIIEHLAALAPRCFHFCIEPASGSGAFLGASPELLFGRHGRTLASEAVAGTRPRSLDAAEDERLEAQLTGLRKERNEHDLVVAAITAALDPLCETLSHDPEPRPLKLARVQHLRTTFAATLREGVSDADLIQALHPTPATCGLPPDRAGSFLREVQPFDRGWYAGPIGVASRHQSDFAVAIRSMHLSGNYLDVFAGAGIVAGSVAEAEWAELESKIGDALRLLAQ